MTKSGKKPPKPSFSQPSESLWSNFLFLSVDDISTTWSPLRADNALVAACELRDQPIRVVFHDGRYEVIDGFKRLSRWKLAGAIKVPVLVEECNDGLSPKQLMLQSNSPKRTITAIDEARVVNSLIEDDGLTVRAAANLLGRRKQWVSERRSLLRLSSHAQLLLGSGRINLMVARLLTALKHEDQDSILDAVEKHGLKMRESQLLIQTWRAASESEKLKLLVDPLCQRESQSAPTHSVRLKALEAKLSAIRQALDEFGSMAIPGDLPEAEQRRLQAICASIQVQISQLAQSYKAEEPVVAEEVAVQPEVADRMPEINDDELYDSLTAPEFTDNFTDVLPCHLPSSPCRECVL